MWPIESPENRAFKISELYVLSFQQHLNFRLEMASIISRKYVELIEQLASRGIVEATTILKVLCDVLKYILPTTPLNVNQVSEAMQQSRLIRHRRLLVTDPQWVDGEMWFLVS